MMIPPSKQHLLACLGALGLGVVMPCFLPGGAGAGTAAALGVGLASGGFTAMSGLASDLLANFFQKGFDDREKDPSRPNRNHDLLKVIANAVAHEIGEYARSHTEALGQQARDVERLAKITPEHFLALFEEEELPDIAPPDAKALLTASTRDRVIPPTGKLEDWQTIVRRLAGRATVVIPPEIENELARQLHEHLWESVRKALKSDFAHDGKGYAALHLQFMGDVMARLDELTQPRQDQAESKQLNRELLEELRKLKLTEADPKARRIFAKAPPGTQAKLHTLIQRYEQLSVQVDRGFKQVLDEVRAADRASRSRDAVTHHRLRWVLAGIAACLVLGGGAYTLIQRGQSRQTGVTERVADTAENIQADTTAIRQSVEGLDDIVDRLLANISDKDQQIGSLRAQLEEAVRRLARAGEQGDEDAREKLEQLRAGADLKLLGQFLDEQIARQSQATVGLLRERAAVAYTTGEIDRAEQCLHGILALVPEDFDAINRLGHVYLLQGDLTAAERQYRRLITLAPHDDLCQSIALGNLGVIAQTRGDLDEAQRLHREALDIDRKLGGLQGQAIDLGNLGVIAQTRGDLDEAERLLREAIDINRKLGRLQGQAGDLGNLGEIAQTRGNLDEAERLHREALDINRRLGGLLGQASDLGNLGEIAQTRGNLDEAQRLHREAHDINRKLGWLQGQASDLGNLGQIAQTRGDLKEAQRFHRHALDINRKLGWLQGQASDLGNLGLIARTRGDLDEAERLHTESLEIERKIGRLVGQARQLGNLGVIADTRGDPVEARRLWIESRDLYARVGMPHRVDQIQDWLDGLAPE
jgi:tetratricopeptide (TPR) repeat protein